VPEGDGVVKTVAYLTRDGNICTASAQAHRGGVRGSYGGCSGTVAYVSRRIARRGGVWAGGALGLDRRTNELLVDGRVESVRPFGKGDWAVKMTPPWTPHAHGARPLRLVLVIDERDIQEADLQRLHASLPTVQLTYPNGSTRRIRFPYAK
jgi:hypothetical protein